MSEMKERLQGLAYVVHHPILTIKTSAKKEYDSARREAENRAAVWESVPCLRSHYWIKEMSAWIICVSTLLIWSAFRWLFTADSYDFSATGLTLPELMAMVFVQFIIILGMLTVTVGPVALVCALMLSVIADEWKAQKNVMILLALAFGLMLLEPVLQKMTVINGVSLATGTFSTVTLTKMLPVVGLVGLAIGVICAFLCWVVQVGAAMHWRFTQKKLQISSDVGVVSNRQDDQKQSFQDSQVND